MSEEETEVPSDRASWLSALRGPSGVLMLCMFFTGACGMVYEYVLSTVATYILGNSIEQFSVIISLMMLMMGVAGIVQSRISDRHLIEKFIATESALAILGALGPLATYAAFCLIPDHFLLIQYAFIVAIGFLIGLEFPLASRINERYAANLRRNLAGTIGLDYVGSFIGALIWAFWLIKTVPLVEIGFFVGGLNVLVAGWTFLYFWRKGLLQRGGFVLGLLAVATAVVGFGATQGQRWADGLEQRLYDDPIVLAKTTPYQRIVLTRNPKLGDTRLYLNGNCQFSSLDEAIYHEHLVHPAMALAPARGRVLVLGGGDGLALREILKYRDVREVTLVDLDPQMVRLAREDPVLQRLNRNAFRDARVHATLPEGFQPTGLRRMLRQETDAVDARRRPETQVVGSVDVYTVDADQFLAKVRGAWDVVLVDLPDPNSVELAKLYSREFYAKIARRLTPKGVVVVQATSPYHAKETYLCVQRTMRAAGLNAIAYHDNVPSFGDWGWFIAQRGLDEPAYREHLQQTELDVQTRYLTPAVMLASLTFGRDQLQSEHRDVSTLMRPVVLRYYLDEGWQID